MPTLEDTVDFKVVTLNDLLDADVRTGVPVAADDKYKRWAFLATGAAAMLAIGLVVALVTGGGDGGSSGTKVSKSVPAPPDTTPLPFLLGTDPGPGIDAGVLVTVLNPADEMGHECARLLLERMSDERGGVRREVVIPHRLVLRASA